MWWKTVVIFPSNDTAVFSDVGYDSNIVVTPQLLDLGCMRIRTLIKRKTWVGSRYNITLTDTTLSVAEYHGDKLMSSEAKGGTKLPVLNFLQIKHVLLMPPRPSPTLAPWTCMPPPISLHHVSFSIQSNTQYHTTRLHRTMWGFLRVENEHLHIYGGGGGGGNAIDTGSDSDSQQGEPLLSSSSHSPTTTVAASSIAGSGMGGDSVVSGGSWVADRSASRSSGLDKLPYSRMDVGSGGSGGGDLVRRAVSPIMGWCLTRVRRVFNWGWEGWGMRGSRGRHALLGIPDIRCFVVSFVGWLGHWVTVSPSDCCIHSSSLVDEVDNLGSNENTKEIGHTERKVWRQQCALY